MFTARPGEHSRLEILDARSFAGHHLVSPGVGLFAFAWALADPAILDA